MEALSNKTKFKKYQAKEKRRAKSIRLTPKHQHFLKWLKLDGINTTKFTYEAWEGTKEWATFDDQYEEIKQGLEAF